MWGGPAPEGSILVGTVDPMIPQLTNHWEKPVDPSSENCRSKCVQGARPFLSLTWPPPTMASDIWPNCSPSGLGGAQPPNLFFSTARPGRKMLIQVKLN